VDFLQAQRGAHQGDQAINSQELVVRAVRRGDFDAWKRLWDGYNAFYGRSGTTALSPEIGLITWSRFLDAHEPIHALVAEHAGSLLGLAHFLYHRSTIHVNPICYLQDLFTTEPSRGRGIGRALIQAVYEHAQAAGSSRVYWQSHETNTAAMGLYDQVAERSGFLVYRRNL
jgi:GNAT superfamily N-acetyltransferase